MSKNFTHMAIAYDFDGTLAPGNMQEHSFIAEIGLSAREFWAEAKAMAKSQDMDNILAYMQLMLEKARSKKVSITKKNIQKHGEGIKLFDGVGDWFPRLNAYAEARHVKLKHYIISSGLREMIKGTSISSEFDYIFASGFFYDANDVAIWPALAVNYTTKTQYLFRINKGILNSYDNEKINKFVEEKDRPVPFTNMVYLGDGETDVPSMKMLKQQNGYSLAVYNPSKPRTKLRKSAKEVALGLIREQRVDYALPADYTNGSPLDLAVKAIIDRTAATARLKRLQT